MVCIQKRKSDKITDCEIATALRGVVRFYMTADQAQQIRPPVEVPDFLLAGLDEDDDPRAGHLFDAVALGARADQVHRAWSHFSKDPGSHLEDATRWLRIGLRDIRHKRSTRSPTSESVREAWSEFEVSVSRALAACESGNVEHCPHFTSDDDSDEETKSDSNWPVLFIVIGVLLLTATLAAAAGGMLSWVMFAG